MRERECECEQPVRLHKELTCRRGDTALRLTVLRFRLETGAGVRCPERGCIDRFARSASLRQILHASAPGMDQEPGVASAGGFMSLSEHEQRYYSGLHGRCQADASGKLSSSKVAELFKASQLPPDALHRVSTHTAAASSSHVHPV